MGIVRNILTNIEKRRLDKLEDKLLKIHRRNNVSFNPYSVGNTIDLLSDKNYSLRTLENFVWYSASIPMLRNYYHVNKQFHSQFSNDDFNYFWGNVPNENRKVHTRIPSLCTIKMVDLLIGNGIKIEPEVFGEDGVINEELTNNVKEIIEEIRKENKFYKLMANSISNESWGGGIAWKINIDKDFSKLPIIDLADARSIELITKYGREQAIEFKQWHEKGEKGKDKYLALEIYSTNENGDATITNELYKLVNDKRIKVPLTEIEETADLEEKITFTGLKGMLAFYKPNRLPNSEFVGSPYGESDYAGCYSLFDSLDEVYSTMMDDVRKGRTIRFIPDTLLPRNNHGEVLKFNDFQLNYMKTKGTDAADFGGENKIETSTPTSKTLDYIEQWKNLLITVLNNVGLSPLTIGVTGLESMNTSDSSQREREKTSLRTRKTKVSLWSEFLELVIVQVLKVYSLYYTEEQINGLEKIDVDESNLNIKVEFGEYIIKPFEERLSTYGDALIKGAISIEEMVEQVYQDTKTEEQKKQEIDRIKMEKGMSLSNVDNLLL